MWWLPLAITLTVAAAANDTSRNVYLTIKNIRAEGYHAEVHEVVTEDGYILEVHRIPYRRYESTGEENRPVLLLVHGMFGASNSFTIYGPRYSMGYNLADAGHDVWIMNSRGTKNSRRHIKLDPDDPTEKIQFFDFSYEELGKYDVAATTDYILNYTKHERIHFVGHSQGGTTFLVLASMRPEYNRKFLSAHLLAPVGYQYHFPHSQLYKLARYADVVYSFSLSLGYVEVYPPNSTAAKNVNTTNLCASYPYLKNLCETLGGRLQLTGSELDSDLIGGGAFKQMAHFGQNIRDKEFRRWNYGPAKNLLIYGTEDPPPYNLRRITVKTIIHCAPNDLLVDERDIVAMARDMAKASVRKVTRTNFLHEEFVTANDAKELVTAYIVESIKKDEKQFILETSYDDDYEYEDETPNSSPKFEPGIVLTTFITILLYCS